MSDLSAIEKCKLEKFLKMEDGYVLDFSNPTFQEFIIDITGIDIYIDKYSDIGNSKAKRLKSFWKQESNDIVGQLISALLEYWKIDKSISPLEQTLFDDCLKISQRLIQKGQEDVDEVAINAHFEKCQKTIIEKIASAKFIIWVAVAWFTDEILFNRLVAKKNQGVNVQLIISDDKTNTDSGLKYETEFETYKILEFGKYKKNTMHNKFCIIDLKTVVHGSYNWTKNAQYNYETITVVNNSKNAEKFAKQFIQLKTEQIAKRSQTA